jgi:glycosyltransferase involved in cell wall biosynthesis
MTGPSIAFAVPGDITTLTGGYIYDRKLLAALQQAGHDVTLLPLPDGFPFPHQAAMAQAVAALQALDPDSLVIIDGLAFGALPPDQVAQISARIVALIHHPLAYESGLPQDQADHLLQTERANLAHAAQVLVPSPHTAETLIRHYDVAENLIHIARPGIEGGPVPTKPQDPPLILSVGILHPRKGHDVLIRALAQIADMDWQAVIVGSPWEAGYQDHLQGLIDDLGLTARAHLTGRISDAALADYYAKAQLFALATRYEGYGMVFNEALIHGLPIISCATGAVPGTVPAAAGLLVPCDDPVAFADALQQVLADPARAGAMRAAAADAARSLGDWSVTAQVAAKAIRQAMA